MSLGAGLASLSAGMIKQFGQQVTVTRLTTGASRLVWAMPQDIDPGADQLRREGDWSAANPDRTMFVMSSSEDVAETIDEITYDGFVYEVLAVHGSPVNGVQPTHEVLCKRIRKAP